MDNRTTVRHQQEKAEDYNELRDQFSEVFSLRKPKDAKAGLSSGAKSMGKGVLAGAVGLFAAPVVLAKEEGAKGFAKGVALGSCCVSIPSSTNDDVSYYCALSSHRAQALYQFARMPRCSGGTRCRCAGGCCAAGGGRGGWRCSDGAWRGQHARGHQGVAQRQALGQGVWDAPAVVSSGPTCCISQQRQQQLLSCVCSKPDSQGCRLATQH